MELVILTGYGVAVGMTAYVGASIVRGIYLDIKTRPSKHPNKDQKKLLTYKINSTKERIQ